MSNINNNENSDSDDNSLHRTSPRFSNSNSPHYYDNNYKNNDINTSTASSANSSSHVTPKSGARKRNSSNRGFSSLEKEQQQSAESSLNSTNMQFYLQKLDLLYQNLEGRVQKLENIVVDHFLITTSNPPYSVVSRNAQINNSGAGFNMSDFSIVSNSTSTSTSTSSSNLIPTVTSTIPTTSSTSTICSLLEPAQKEITVNIKSKIITHVYLFRNLT